MSRHTLPVTVDALREAQADGHRWYAVGSDRGEPWATGRTREAAIEGCAAEGSHLAADEQNHRDYAEQTACRISEEIVAQLEAQESGS